MNINVHVLSGDDSIGLQIFDHLYAYDQSINADYKSNLKIKFSNIKLIDSDAINILFAQFPTTVIHDAADYDLVLLDNRDEPLTVSSQQIYDTLHQCKNSYLIANSILHKTHPLNSRLLQTLNDFFLMYRGYNTPLYPQYYYKPSITNRKNLFLINGANRAHRCHFISRITQYVPELGVRSVLSTNDVIHETNDCFFESPEDTRFREWVNNNYPITRNARSSYYNNMIKCGIDDKFGSLPPGYFMLDEYYNHNCIIFPEASWLNGELSITEKALKCFYAKTFPFPLGGAYINQIYNTLGFYTAWNLLPAELQVYDSNLDHLERSDQVGLAIKYLHENPEVFETEQAQRFIELNYINVLTNKFNLPIAEKFLKLIKQCKETKRVN